MSIARIVATLVERGEEDLAEELLGVAALQGPFDERKVPVAFKGSVNKMVNPVVAKIAKLAMQAQKDGHSADLINHYLWQAWSAHSGYFKTLLRSQNDVK